MNEIHPVEQLNVGYYFPTKTDVLEFSKSRVSPLLADNPFLARLMRDTDTAGLKRIGDAYGTVNLSPMSAHSRDGNDNEPLSRLSIPP